MANEPYVVIEEEGAVFNSNGDRPYWDTSDSEAGHVVGPEAAPLAEIVASGYFLLPRIPARSGVYNVFTLERRRRTPDSSRLRDADLFADGLEGVYASLVFDAGVASFAAGMNVGSGDEELQGFFLRNLTPEEEVAGRVLQFMIFVAHPVLFAGVEAVWDAPEMSAFGRGPATGSLFRPWRAPPEGEWVATSGEVPGTSFLPFPPGFELADVRVVLRRRAEDDGSLAVYSGALDPSPPALLPEGSETSLLMAMAMDGEEWTYGF